MKMHHARTLPPCLEACYRVPLLHTPLGVRLLEAAVMRALERRDVRAFGVMA
jgi:hypothetical protein